MPARLLKWLFKDFWLKLLALFIATLLWYALARDPVAEVAFHANIEFLNRPADLEFNSDAPQQVEIRVRGPARIIGGLTSDDVHPVIDLRDATVGERSYQMSPQRIQSPHEVEVVQVVPAEIRVSFDHREYREVEVRPRVLGTFATGYRLVSASAVPPKVVIVGPARRVRLVDEVLTDPVDASGAVGHATFTTHAYIADPLVRMVNPQPIRVTVVTERSTARTGVP